MLTEFRPPRSSIPYFGLRLQVILPRGFPRRSTANLQEDIPADRGTRKPPQASGRAKRETGSNDSTSAAPMLLTALAGAASIALLTVVLFALTAIPHPYARLADPNSSDVTDVALSPHGTIWLLRTVKAAPTYGT